MTITEVGFSMADPAKNHERVPRTDFHCGDALEVLRAMPDASIDCCITSPPYWGQREYNGGGIGLEKTPAQYVDALCEIIEQVQRVLKPTGSFWLNIGDTYRNKSLLGSGLIEFHSQ